MDDGPAVVAMTHNYRWRQLSRWEILPVIRSALPGVRRLQRDSRTAFTQLYTPVMGNSLNVTPGAVFWCQFEVVI